MAVFQIALFIGLGWNLEPTFNDVCLRGFGKWNASRTAPIRETLENVRKGKRIDRV